MSVLTWLRKAEQRAGFTGRKRLGRTFTADELREVLEARSRGLGRLRLSSHMGSSPASEWLAAIHAGNEVPDEQIRDRFDKALAAIVGRHPGAPEHIADFLVAGRFEMEDRGGSISLLSLAESAAQSTQAAGEGRAPEMESAFELITLMLLVEVGAPSASGPGTNPPRTMPTADSPYLRIFVSKAGAISLDGKGSTLKDVAAAFDDLARNQGVVIYSREAPEEYEGHPNGVEVIRLLAERSLPVRFSTRADFSDAVGSDGKLKV